MYHSFPRVYSNFTNRSRRYSLRPRDGSYMALPPVGAQDMRRIFTRVNYCPPVNGQYGSNGGTQQNVMNGNHLAHVIVNNLVKAHVVGHVNVVEKENQIDAERANDQANRKRKRRSHSVDNSSQGTGKRKRSLSADVEPDARKRARDVADAYIFSPSENASSTSTAQPFVVVFDTCGLMHPKGTVLLRRLKQVAIDAVIPQAVISELDGLKLSSEPWKKAAACVAREANRLIRDYTDRQSRDFSRHVHVETSLSANRPLEGFPIVKNDDRILKAALQTRQELANQVGDKIVHVIVVTEDNNFSINVNSYRNMGIASARVDSLIDRINRLCPQRPITPSKESSSSTVECLWEEWGSSIRQAVVDCCSGVPAAFSRMRVPDSRPRPRREERERLPSISKSLFVMPDPDLPGNGNVQAAALQSPRVVFNMKPSPQQFPIPARGFDNSSAFGVAPPPSNVGPVNDVPGSGVQTSDSLSLPQQSGSLTPDATSDLIVFNGIINTTVHGLQSAVYYPQPQRSRHYNRDARMHRYKLIEAARNLMARPNHMQTFHTFWNKVTKAARFLNNGGGKGPRISNVSAVFGGNSWFVLSRVRDISNLPNVVEQFPV